MLTKLVQCILVLIKNTLRDHGMMSSEKRNQLRRRKRNSLNSISRRARRVWLPNTNRWYPIFYKDVIANISHLIFLVYGKDCPED